MFINPIIQHYTVKSFCLMLLILFGCASDEEPFVEANSDPSSITIDAQPNYSGALNQTFELTAIVRDAQGNILAAQIVNWQSSDSNIATISSNGTLRLLSDGQVEITASVESINDSRTLNISLTSSSLRAFTVDELSNQLMIFGVSELLFLDESTMSGTYLELAVGESTQSTTIDRDQVYYFFDGSVTMNVEGQTITVEVESAVFVAANSNRSITSINSDTKIIRTELKSDTNQSPDPFLLKTRAQMEAPRNPNVNVWNPFLNQESVIFGLYMLPETIGGDNRLAHPFDELNIITRGSSQFITDDGNIPVTTGSIVFVKEGNGHEFNELDGDHDILILWNK